MRAKFEIKRRSEVCGTIFMAPTLESRYCCRHCTDVAYKQIKAYKVKQERMKKQADNVTFCFYIKNENVLPTHAYAV